MFVFWCCFVYSLFFLSTFRFFRKLFVIIFLLQIRHNVTSIASKRDNRCIRKRCVAGSREKEIKQANDKKSIRVKIHHSPHCFDDCLMFFTCFSSLFVFFFFLASVQRHEMISLRIICEKRGKKEAKLRDKPRTVSSPPFLHIRQKESTRENEKEKHFMRANSTTHTHTHTNTSTRKTHASVGVNLATVCTLLQLQLSFSN